MSSWFYQAVSHLELYCTQIQPVFFADLQQPCLRDEVSLSDEKEQVHQVQDSSVLVAIFHPKFV